ncbi:MAG: AraC family transcriptional regulator [Candidatus Obscuribacterales bacterium]|nr:AraC family transcriptional regulator [Candidatus Obscuribacterales bacterium]
MVRQLLPTTILWTPAGVSHSAKWDSAWYSVGILIGKEFLDSSLSQMSLRRYEKTSFFHARQELTTLLKLALSPDWLDKTSTNQPFARSLAVLLSNEFASCYQAGARLWDNSNEKLPLKRLIDFIDSNLERELCLQDLAEFSNLSPHHFSRLFKNTTGYSPYQYIVSRRLSYGLHLLSSKALSVDEIAASTGFASASSFSKAFKRVYRVSPAEYLKNLVSE